MSSLAIRVPGMAALLLYFALPFSTCAYETRLIFVAVSFETIVEILVR